MTRRRKGCHNKGDDKKPKYFEIQFITQAKRLRMTTGDVKKSKDCGLKQATAEEEMIGEDPE